MSGPTTPLDGYAIIDGKWYDIGPVDDRGNGLVIVADEAEAENLAHVMEVWEAKIADMIGTACPEVAPEHVDGLAADIVATLWEVT